MFHLDLSKVEHKAEVGSLRDLEVIKLQKGIQYWIYWG